MKVVPRIVHPGVSRHPYEGQRAAKRLRAEAKASQDQGQPKYEAADDGSGYSSDPGGGPGAAPAVQRRGSGRYPRVAVKQQAAQVRKHNFCRAMPVIERQRFCWLVWPCARVGLYMWPRQARRCGQCMAGTQKTITQNNAED
jgi:hypothetical protein